jgi:DNA-binding response OmpR family regulator
MGVVARTWRVPRIRAGQVYHFEHVAQRGDLLSHVLGSVGYQLAPARSLATFDRALAHAEAIRLALVDIAGVDARMWEPCERLRGHGISFLVLSPHQSQALQQASLSHGAHRLLTKPLVIRELRGLMRCLLEGG